MTTTDIAGEVPSSTAFEMLQADDNAVLLDVRTVPEWQFVGVPDLRGIGKQTMHLSWQVYPEMTPHPDFVAAALEQGVQPEQTVLVICRSGARSRAAALALTQAGFSKAYNVSDGFEGNPDAAGHRGRTGGWKVAGLPWVQQ